MRLNWFLPHKSYFGLPGRLLRRTVPSWRNSPLRRIAQTLALATFIAILFYAMQPAALTDGPTGGEKTFRNFMQCLPPQLFLILDPLANILASLAARAWTWSLAGAAVLLCLSLLVPRGFCGYVCPLGTLIDLFDWVIGGRFKRLHLRRRRWHVNLKYYLLAAVVLSALLGVTFGSFIAAIPLLTRGLVALGRPWEWTALPVVALLAIVLILGLFGRRFWCRYVCPTGAAFSLLNLLRLTDRKVTPKCTECGRCVRVCPFDAIKDDFATRGADCTFCQTCGGACPTGAIEFRPRWQNEGLRPTVPQSPEVSLSRRGLLASGLGAAGLWLGLPRIANAGNGESPIRPPLSLPEQAFGKTCIRCGLCVKACPTNLLQPLGLQAGVANIWTPYANADWGKCDPACVRCGKVCPTGAIERFSAQEKKSRKMGLAQVDQKTCLAYLGESCGLCAVACAEAGYSAIDLDESDPARPTVDPASCVGCGACQHACRTEVVLAGKLMTAAIKVKSIKP